MTSSRINSSILALIALAGVAIFTAFVVLDGGDAQASGGVLPPEQAAFDVTFYELTLAVDPEARRIDGELALTARVLSNLDVLLLDLDHRLTVDSVSFGGETVTFSHKGDRLRAELPDRLGAGDTLTALVYYGGQPRSAPNAPWSGGFTWAKTPDGAPWIATSCQEEGADIWWPVKDHPSDEADSVALHVTVPDTLIVAANGRSRGVTRHADGTATYHWFSSMPVNSYAVALNIAPYDTVQSSFRSVDDSTTVPVTFWVVPEQRKEARAYLPEFVDHVRYLEELLGPYPFRADKYGIAHTPFLGMEHQTIIAYGNRFGNDAIFGYDQGFDALHFHELAHEWWGNLVTVSDWKDFWIHEGFASYMEALYAEHLHGEVAYHDVIDHQYTRIANDAPTARRVPSTSKEVYTIDVYMKGSNVLHTLRYLIGDEAFFVFLRRMAYPTEALAAATDGSQTRFVDTDEVVRVAEEVSGEELEGFFDMYLYHAALPELVTERRGDDLELRWETPARAAFELPVPVRIDQDTVRVPMPGGHGRIEVHGRDVEVDPRRWILRAR